MKFLFDTRIWPNLPEKLYRYGLGTVAVPPKGSCGRQDRAERRAAEAVAGRHLNVEAAHQVFFAVRLPVAADVLGPLEGVEQPSMI